jgi:membrane-associated phospholipid phosphatase
MPDKGFSFPSGHSAGVVVFVGMLAYFAWQHWANAKVRAGIAGVFGALVVVVGFDRVYLNAHWISDVFGGWLFGAFWLSLVILVYGWFDSRGFFQTRWFNLAANVLYVLAVVVAVLVVLFGAVS